MNAKDARAVFDACVAIVRKEAGTAQFLLPHVVLAVLTSPGDAEAVSEVAKEMNAVLSAEEEEDAGREAECGARDEGSICQLASELTLDL